MFSIQPTNVNVCAIIYSQYVYCNYLQYSHNKNWIQFLFGSSSIKCEINVDNSSINVDNNVR